MLKHIILAIFLCAIVAHARPQAEEPEITVLRNTNENTDTDIKWGFEFSDGTKQEQTGYVKNAGTDMEMTIVMGSYSYPLADGRTITVTYTADENGYKPVVTYT